MLAIGVLALSMGVYFSSVGSYHLPAGVGYQAALAFIAVVGALAIGTGALLEPGPTLVAVTGTGVEIVHPRRGTRTLKWNDPRIHIILQDFREPATSVPGYLARRSGIMWISPGFRGFDLSTQALEGIVNRARMTGLAVSDGLVTSTSAGGLRGVRQYDISAGR